MEHMPKGRLFVLPAKLDDCEVPDVFEHLHWVNLYEDDGLDKIVEAIRTIPRK